MIGVVEAIEVMNARKKAAIEAGGAIQSELSTEEVARLVVCLGTDLDYDELLGLKEMLWVGPTAALQSGVDGKSVLHGHWVDGLVTGLVLADLRRREESRDH